MIATHYTHLCSDPKSLYKQLFVKGTRIPARVLYGRYVNAEEPMTPENIAADYGIPIEAVREAIAYCETDPPEIRQDYEAEEALMEAMGMNDPENKHQPTLKLLSPEELHRLNQL